MKKIIKFVRKHTSFMLFLIVFVYFLILFVTHGDLHKLITAGVLSILFNQDLNHNRRHEK